MTRFATILGFCLEGVFALWLVVWARMDSKSMIGFGELLDHVFTSRAARLTLILFWWWLGFHFLVVLPEGS